MTVYIGGARHDEHGSCYENGKAGDQTGTEVAISAWWNYPWGAVYRCKDEKIRQILANNMIDATCNEKIGYDMNDRNSLYKYWKAQGRDIAKVTTACECDCSSLVSLCVTQAGIDILTGTVNAPVTATLGDYLMKTGKFEKLTGKILTDPSLLVRGDILVKPYGHTEIVLGTSKEKVVINEEKKDAAVNDFGIEYSAHVQGKGWLPVVHDGLIAGTTGESRRLEALKIVCPKAKEGETQIKVSGKAHIQGIGWKSYGEAEELIIGTTGESRRLEAVELTFTGLPSGKKIHYQAHCQSIGWQAEVLNGFPVGTTGMKKSIEAFKIWCC